MNNCIAITTEKSDSSDKQLKDDNISWASPPLARLSNYIANN